MSKEVLSINLYLRYSLSSTSGTTNRIYKSFIEIYWFLSYMSINPALRLNKRSIMTRKLGSRDIFKVSLRKSINNQKTGTKMKEIRSLHPFGLWKR